MPNTSTAYLHIYPACPLCKESAVGAANESPPTMAQSRPISHDTVALFFTPFGQHHICKWGSSILRNRFFF